MFSRLKLLISTFIVLAVAARLAPAVAAEGLTVTLSIEAAGPSTLAASSGVPLRFTLQNESRTTLRVARWQTALTGDLYGPIFSVTREGREVEYVGKIYKLRATPLASDYITLRAGASTSRVIDLSEFYDLSGGGSYAVTYRAPVSDSVGAAAIGTSPSAPHVSNVVYFERAPGAAPAAGSAGSDDITTQALAPVFRSCSSSRQTTLRTALPNAENYARESLSFLQNLPSSQRPSNARYKTWFGAYTSSRYSTVQSHFSKIAGALTGRTIAFHCDCNDSAYAYVFSNDPYNIHLCQAFWSAPARGRDSKAGTIIHEMSHFDVNGGTDDHVYGETGAKNLARTSPSRAVMNADSHEYFAEQ